MKRSKISKALKELEAACKEYKCYLPPFCSFTPEQWQTIGYEYDEACDCMLGWDITDYGLGDFDKVGFSFNPPVGRFPKIEVDEPPYRLL